MTARMVLAAAVLLAASPAPAQPAADRGQIGVYGGIGPAEALHTSYLVGGWGGVGLGEQLRLEISGSYQEGLSQSSELYDFLRKESLLDDDDALADRVRWTAECLLRVEPLRGKLAFLQAVGPAIALHLGAGGGVRALASDAGDDHLAPTGVLAAGSDFRLTSWLLLRLDAHGYGALRRDDTFGLGAELLAGLGGRL